MKQRGLTLSIAERLDLLEMQTNTCNSYIVLRTIRTPNISEWWNQVDHYISVCCFDHATVDYKDGSKVNALSTSRKLNAWMKHVHLGTVHVLNLDEI